MILKRTNVVTSIKLENLKVILDSVSKRHKKGQDNKIIKEKKQQ
jgi:hypothetical protein